MKEDRTELERVLAALQTLRVPLQTAETDLHALVMQSLKRQGVDFIHEAKLAPRCRIDLLCGGVGVEIKRGRQDRARVREQLKRYAECAQICSLVLVSERAIDLPDRIMDKPVRTICLNRLWGIAL